MRFIAFVFGELSCEQFLLIHNVFKPILKTEDILTMDNGLLFHMTQPTNRSTTRSHCTEQTNHNSEYQTK